MPIAAAKTSNAAGINPVVKPAQQLVSHVFFGAILKQMHQSPWRSEMFSGGQAGRNFESLLDDRLADRMAGNSAGRTLVHAIVKKLEKQAEAIEKRKAANPKAVVPGGSDSAPADAPTDPVDAVLASAAGHLAFLSQEPRIDLKG